ncbi:porin [Pseudoalteromonas tunicata]|uniref:porin n=1 Tax=Pseudoalteromonas tunicata TaxID=314281 RepID=UPI00273FAAC1|nr:porin [Pseudoalteromonas tunicata]MDP4984015.1 porin [Pseudoalteromonas tunicata]
MKLKLLAGTIAIICSSIPAHAEVRINGFASVIGGMALDKNTELFGYSDELSFENESLFALQISADLQDNLSATAQIVAKGENDYNAEFEWAYLTYQINDHTQVSAGRMRVPFYRYSDFLDVGYAYRWIRPPKSVYNLAFSTYEGVSFVYNSQLGSWDSTLQLIGGAYSGDVATFTDNDPAKLNAITGINWTLAYDWLSLRAAYLIAETSISAQNSPEFTGLIAGLNSYGLTTQTDDLLIEKDDGSFLGIGFSIDYENFLLDGEYTELEVKDSFVAPQKQFYLAAGYRIDNWLIHMTYESRDVEHEKSKFNTIPTTFVHPVYGTLPLSTDPTNPNAPLLRDLTNAAIAGTTIDSSSYSFGVRYDFHPSAAFKVDYTVVDNAITNKDSDVIAFGVDLVF